MRRRLFGCDDPQLQTVEVDIHDERAVSDVLLVAQHSLSLKKVMHGLRCVLDKGQIARRCLERGRCVLPIDFRCAFAKELVADELRGFANRLQLDTLPSRSFATISKANGTVLCSKGPSMAQLSS